MNIWKQRFWLWVAVVLNAICGGKNQEVYYKAYEDSWRRKK